MHRRIYLASSWRNSYQPNVVAILRNAGHEVYDFRNPAPGENGFRWSEVDIRWRTWTRHQYISALDHSIAKLGFARDFDAMQWADTCVLLLPCGRSAHLEAGWFVGAGKSLHILLLEQQEPELMYKMATSINTDVDQLLGRLAVEQLRA